MGGVQSSAQNLGDALWMHERQRQRGQREGGGRYEPQEGQSTGSQDRRKLLKRTRSLAVISEDTSRAERESRHFQLDEPEFDLPRRPQLIPRAKLIDRNSLKDRLSKSQQHLSESYDRFNESRSYHSQSTCDLYSIPPALSSLPDPPLYGRTSRADPDRLNILDWPRTPRRYRSHQDLDTVSGLVDIVEDDWPIDDYRSIDCIYSQAKRKRKEHRSLDSILIEDEDELEYFDVLNLLPLSKVRLEFDESDAPSISSHNDDNDDDSNCHNNSRSRSHNSNDISANRRSTSSRSRRSREFASRAIKNHEKPTSSEHSEDSAEDSDPSGTSADVVKITELEVAKHLTNIAGNFTDEEKCQVQPRREYPEIVEFHERRDSHGSRRSLASFAARRPVDREVSGCRESPEVSGSRESPEVSGSREFPEASRSPVGTYGVDSRSTLRVESGWKEAGEAGKWREEGETEEIHEPVVVTTLKEVATRSRGVEEAEDYKSIWISDSEEPEEMSRRPQVLKVVDNDVTRKRGRAANVVDVEDVARDNPVSKDRDFATAEMNSQLEAREIKEEAEANRNVEENEMVGMPSEDKPDVTTARNFFETRGRHGETTRNRRNEGRFERIVKETSSILGKACNAVRGSLGFEARSESSDLGLGSDCGSDTRRRSIDDGVDVVDDAVHATSDQPKPAPRDQTASHVTNGATTETGRKSRTSLTRSRSCVDSIECQDNDDDGPEFDHVRYKIVKSRLFGKNIFGNAVDKRDVTYDGLMEYLREYSFQELLLDNNVVIIEPVRAETVERKPSSVGTKSHGNGGWRISGSSEKKANGAGGNDRGDEKTNENGDTSKGPKQSSLRKHFFYHPIRVNRELIDEELPDPDTVRNVRRMFENTFRSKSASKGTSSGDCKSRMCVSMKDLSSIEERRLDDVNERGFEPSSRSRSSSRAKDLTRLFEGLDKTPSRANQAAKGDLESPKSETKTRILAQSFEARSGNTSPSDSGSTGNKISRCRHQSHRHTHHRRQRQSNWDAGSVSSGVSSDYQDTDQGSGAHCTSSEDEDVDPRDDYESRESDRVSGHFVSQDVLRKIRECGTSVTYYGGKVVNTCNGPLISPMSCKLAKRSERALLGNEDYVKFRLVKSNSCDSRLELAGRVIERRSRLEARESSARATRDRSNDLRDTTIAETPSIEITTMDHRVEDAMEGEGNGGKGEGTAKREPPVVIGLEPKKDENKEGGGFKADFKLGKIEDTKAGYVNRFGSALTRWQVNENNWKKTNADFGKMEFEEFEVLDDSLNGNEN